MSDSFPRTGRSGSKAEGTKAITDNDAGKLIGTKKGIVNGRADVSDRFLLADRAGLEPAASGLTVRHSDHLSYPSVENCEFEFNELRQAAI